MLHPAGSLRQRGRPSGERENEHFWRRISAVMGLMAAARHTSTPLVMARQPLRAVGVLFEDFICPGLASRDRIIASLALMFAVLHTIAIVVVNLFSRAGGWKRRMCCSVIS
jgi:hypothetical protein